MLTLTQRMSNDVVQFRRPTVGTVGSSCHVTATRVHIIIKAAAKATKLTMETALLDLLSFDTVDHVTLLRHLEVSYDISGTVNTWFTLTLGGRWQYVCSGSTKSTPVAVLFGVVLGS